MFREKCAKRKKATEKGKTKEKEKKSEMKIPREKKKHQSQSAAIGSIEAIVCISEKVSTFGQHLTTRSLDSLRLLNERRDL